MEKKPRLSVAQIVWMSFGFMGIQCAFGLQNGNASRILENYGAKVHELSWFWLVAPLTGMLVQPLIGYFSDKTWTRLGRRKPYWQMEQLRGLDQLPAHGFDVAVFPLRLKDASAAPARVAVACVAVAVQIAVPLARVAVRLAAKVAGAFPVPSIPGSRHAPPQAHIPSSLKPHCASPSAKPRT